MVCQWYVHNVCRCEEDRKLNWNHLQLYCKFLKFYNKLLNYCAIEFKMFDDEQRFNRDENWNLCGDYVCVGIERISVNSAGTTLDTNRTILRNQVCAHRNAYRPYRPGSRSNA